MFTKTLQYGMSVKNIPNGSLFSTSFAAYIFCNEYVCNGVNIFQTAAFCVLIGHF